ncbi:MFS transporter [Brevibacillus sp. SYP-B805]|uniref:MFS transporter n=1 Tax=Brevibacillus sp. SYP-B805 TaxID=1578199 RepID=UPI0013EC273C|nr:MFS transporter [Brevibacillus sp. SYP-B805]
MQKKPLALLFATMFLIMLGFGMIIPILPYFAESVGATSLEIGILFSSYNIMQFLFSPIWGALSDRFGRKPLILFGLFGFSVTFILFGLSTTYAEMLGYRIIGGIVSAAAIPTVTAMAADLLPPAERAKGMGMIGAGVGLSFVLGPAIGGLLSAEHLTYPFFAAGIVALVTLVFAAAVLPESLPPGKRGAGKRDKRDNPLVALFGSMAMLYNVLFVVSFTFAGLETTFALYIHDRYHLTSRDLGYMFLVMGVIAAIVQGGLIGRMVRKWGEPNVLSLGLLLYAVGFASILLADSFWSFAFNLSLFGAGQGMIRATATSLITQRTTQGQGVTTGTMGSMDSLGRILGPLAGGALYGWSPNAPFVLGAVLILLILILFRTRSGDLGNSQAC